MFFYLLFIQQIFLRNRLKYALTGREVTLIVKQRLVAVDNKIRTDETYPAGFMDVISIEKSGEHFRLLYDIKGRFAVHRITAEEATYKLLKVKKVQLGAKGVPFLVTHDGRTIRYPDPAIKVCLASLFSSLSFCEANHSFHSFANRSMIPLNSIS